jgi:Ca-activated chloride channel family protein
MKEPKDFYNDPQLTAYALGELEGDERAAVEAALQTDAAARAAVDEIRATARQLEAALAAEPMPDFKSITALPAQRAAIIPGRDLRKLDGGPLRKLIKFPQAYYLIPALAAACFAVMVTLHESERRRYEREKQQTMIVSSHNEENIKKSAAGSAAGGMLVGQEEAEAKAANDRERRDYTEVALSAPADESQSQLQAQAIAAGKISALTNKDISSQQAVVDAGKRPTDGVTVATDASDVGSETMTGVPVNRPIAGVNNSVALDFPSRGRERALVQIKIEDTANYAEIRQYLQAGKLPPSVDTENLINYFPYDYAPPRDDAPLSASLEVAAAPWAPTHRLVRIGLKAREVTASGRPVMVAKNVKVQVEFNPAQVQSYRLIGSEESRHIQVGHMGAGRAVTLLYEIVPAGTEAPAAPGFAELKYQNPGAGSGQPEDGKQGEVSQELLTVTVGCTPPEGGASQQLKFPLTDRGATFAEASMDFKFAAAVAGFGMILHESPFKGKATLAAVEQWARQGLGPDPRGYRAAFIGLVRLAEKLKG